MDNTITYSEFCNQNTHPSRTDALSKVTSDAFIDYLTSRLPLVQSYKLSRNTGHADLERYLYGPLVEFQANAGKLVRPILCLLAASALGGSEKQALKVACAIEVFQTAALIHDDIADEGLMRRGKPCLHRSIGIGLALNCGDLALDAVTSELILGGFVDPGQPDFDDATKMEILRTLHQMTRLTIEGQALDLGWSRDCRWDITPDDYLEMATLKTAHYSCATPLTLGAICAGRLEAIPALRRFGLKCGLAFQIQDDLLNLTGDAQSQGKDFRSDITEGKKTLIVTLALSHLGATESQELIDILSSHTKDVSQINRACELLRLSGSIQKAQDFAIQLTDSALKDLQDVNLDAAAHDILCSMAHFFITRNA